MAYKKIKCGEITERRSFSKAANIIELKDLVEIQTDSYTEFLEKGIKEVFASAFPVESFSGDLLLEFGDYNFGSPKYSIKECKEKEASYTVPLRVEAKLFNNESGEVKEQEIFLGDIPVMTESGTFVWNGAERAIVSQLVRSPGVYFSRDYDKNGRLVIKSTIIPNRGTWLEYETDAKNVVYVRIDRTRKVPITTLLRAVGLSGNENIFDLFGENEYISNTIEKDSSLNSDQGLMEIYEKLRPGEPITLDGAKNQLISSFFDEFKYTLADVGRYKYNLKLNIMERLRGLTIAENVKDGKKVIVEKGTVLTKKVLDELKPYFEKGYGIKEVIINKELDTHDKVQEIKVYSPNDKKKIVKVIGNDPSTTVERLTISDLYASVSYYLNLLEGIGNDDEIDHLSNRRVKQVGELIQNQFRVGVSRMERVIRERMNTQEIDEATPKTLINIRPVTAAIKEFFGSSQLSQFMDQHNPIAELTHKRRLSALGPGGLSRDRAGMEVRDVNTSHYGRICPIESPEGPNIGLISTLASYAKVNKYGFIMTPYRKVINKKVTDEIVYMTADEERDYLISEATIKLDKDNKIITEKLAARLNGDAVIVPAEDINYIDISPQQVVSITTSCIPFLEHDDAARTLMGANMQRQAVPLLEAEAPLVATGVEYNVAKYSGAVVVAKAKGVVEYVDANKIIVKTAKAKDTYYLYSYERSNQDSCYNQKAIVNIGDKIKRGQIIADGPSTKNGELALGKNPVVAFMTFDGYNYEDAVILNERLVKDDVYTSVHIHSFSIECRDTKLGPEELTRDIPNVGEEARKNLDADGIVIIGTEVKEGDILVGKLTPKGVAELTSEEKLLHAIFGEKTREVRDTSLRVDHGSGGIVHDVKVFTKKDTDELSSGVIKKVRVYIAQKRKISVGDKMAGRHGNKGVVSLVLPEEDMPYLPDGRTVDIMLNPQGVPSRMNIGQLMELHLGMAAHELGVKFATPVFDGATDEEIKEMLREANLDETGKMDLYDGRTGKKFDNPISVGVMYMIKLHHMVDDKLHARSTGPYSLVTQQPLGGKAQFGGQRFGEMEVWALYAYGAAHTLQEILTVKSDDVIGRVKVYEALVKGNPVKKCGAPESFKVLMQEFKALGLDVSLVDKDMNEVDIAELEADYDSDKEIKLTVEEKLAQDKKLEEAAKPLDENIDVESFEEGE